MTQAELAAYVESHLEKKGIEVVLSGGACVAIHSQGQYVSMDVDLINVHGTPRGKLRQAMEELGLKRRPRTRGR